MPVKYVKKLPEISFDLCCECGWVHQAHNQREAYMQAKGHRRQHREQGDERLEVRYGS